ncbi:MAG: helix-turn-helix transcriptional regulator [Sphaerochaetaceae bacterium]|nr:helix-turn-helix transcriptional regulator [Sphaerochaetaceae bacterium]
MNQVKTGKFIAQLRKEANLTQEALGDKVGVTNKTVSRWENGNYMPDIEILGLLSKEFNVSINEILAGERLNNEDFRTKADENIVSISKKSAFTFEEKKAWLISKWRREHVPLFIILALIWIAIIIASVSSHRYYLLCFVPLIMVIEYGWQNNQMMIWVESILYEKVDNSNR